MRFSTRNTHKRGKAIALAASAAVLGIGGVVGYITEKGASAETAFNNDNFYFALKSDYDGINSAQTKAGSYFGSGSNPVYCQEKDFTNPRTNASAAYYVFANNPTGEGAHDYCAEIPTNPTILNDNGASILSKTYNDTYMAQNYAQPLGVLGAFHLMGFDQLDLGNQTNGNIITKNLNSAGSYIGYFEEPTISYARQIGTSIGTNFSFANAHNNATNVLVTGYQAPIGTGDNGTKWAINGNKSNMPDRIINGQYADNVWQEEDADQQFIDIESLRTNAKSWNASLAGMTDTLSSADYDFSDENNLRINIPSATKGQLNVLTLGKDHLSKEYLQGHHDICVYGFDQHTPGTLLINVDLADVTEFEMNNSFKLCYRTADEVKYPESINANATSTDDIDFTDNQRDCVREQWIHDKFENHVIVNFYNSESNDKLYTGDIEISRETTSFVVAPDSDIRITASSFQGLLIAKTIDSEADTYYLSLHPQLPLGQVSECTIEINHYLAGTTTKIAASDTVTNTCEHAERTVQPTTTFTDSTKTYGFVSAEYVEDGDEANKEDITDDLPMTVFNSKTSQVYNLYYNETCSYVINHVNYYDTSTVYTTQTGTVVCNTPVEVGHLQSVVDNGHTPVYDDGSVVEIISTLPKNVDGRPTTFTVRYKDPCTIDVYHRLKGTQTNLAEPEHYDGFCHELSKTISLSESVLEHYDFDNAIETESDTAMQKSEFPYNTGAITANQTYIIEYEAKSTPQPETCAIYIHHYKKGTTEKVDDDISMENTCNNIQMQVEISKKALANGYVFSSAKMESERIVIEDFSEDEFPLATTNNFPVKVYTIYYEKTPDTPNTKDNNPAFMLTAAGTVFGLSTAVIFLARRRS